MSVFRTLKRGGQDLINTIISAIKTYLALENCDLLLQNLLQNAEVLQFVGLIEPIAKVGRRSKGVVHPVGRFGNVVSPTRELVADYPLRKKPLSINQNEKTQKKRCQLPHLRGIWSWFKV